jgi:uncharacterized membrane protein YphA (DoxX/SURF4 family)
VLQQGPSASAAGRVLLLRYARRFAPEARIDRTAAAQRFVRLTAVNPSEARSRAFALLFARLVLGLIFFMAGVYKVFSLTPAGHVRKWFLPYQDTFLPDWSLWAAGLAIPFVELIAGAALLAGWRIREALLALGAVLVIVTFGHLLKEPLYPFHEHVLPRLALLLFLLVMPRQDDRFSVDGFLRSRGGRARA